MATQLTQVVKQMSRSNENLSMLASKNAPVEDVANLWQEAYASSRHTMSSMSAGEGETAVAEREHSSLSVFDRENRL
jgi:hypothetical protein